MALGLGAGEKPEPKDSQTNPADRFLLKMMDLREMMEHRGAEGLEIIAEKGGVLSICKGVRSDPVKGKMSVNTIQTFAERNRIKSTMQINS
jgi:hypothetical protein